MNKAESKKHNTMKSFWLYLALSAGLVVVPCGMAWAQDADSVAEASDLDNDNDGILDTDEGYASVVPSPLASSFIISTSTQAGTSGALTPASISGFGITDTSSGNQLSFTAQTSQTQTSNDSNTEPNTSSGTFSEVTIDVTRDPEEVITGSTFTYSTGGNFDDGLYVEINNVAVVSFSQWDWDGEAGFGSGGKFDSDSSGSWTPWSGEGNPELVVDFIAGTVELLVDTAGGGREDALDDIDAVPGVDPTPNPVPTPDWSTPVKIGTTFLNHDGPGGIDIQTLDFSLTFMTHRDTDGDSVFDYLDIDSDNDGISDLYESGADAGTLDPDSNGVIDGAQFTDADSDGLADAIESTEGANNGTTPAESGADGDSTPDYIDLDSDGDGIPDAIEAQLTSVYTANYSNDGNVSNDDSDGDGAIDAYDGVSGHGGNFSTPVNTDGTDAPDYLDTNSDNDDDNDSIEGGSAVTGVSYNDPDGSAHNGTSFTLLDTDSDVDADGANATPLSQDFDYREQADFGDAPISYGAASHYPTTDLYLGGGQPDLDPGNQPSVGADGDDGDGNDDEDSTSIAPLDNGTTDYSLSVSVTNSRGSAATLYGWVDFDGDGTFDQSERTSVAVPNGTSGNLSLDWSGVSPSVGISYVRLRLSADDLTAGESNDGGSQDDVSISAAGDGEVEDYQVIISDVSEIYFEAECAVIGNDWLIGTDNGASQNVYVEPDNNRTGNISTTNQIAENMLQYQITVPLAGTYDLYVLAEAPGGADDSFFYSLNATNSWTTFNGMDNGAGFDWIDLEAEASGGQAYQEVVTTTPNEVVNIYISWREDGILIDKFALLSDDSAVPSGQGDPVEGCFDFGDAPDTALNSTGTGDYISLFANNTPGPLHAVDNSPAVYLGDTAPDTETDALQNSSASGDDSNDEGAAQLLTAATGDSFPVLMTTDTSYSVEVDVTNSKDVNATLLAWIDFDRDGQFEGSELADTNPVISGGSGSTTATLNWTGLSGLSVGDTFIRLRLSTDVETTSKNSTNVLIDGEVEDHRIGIFDVDYGDAPEAVYGSAGHYIMAAPTLYLGPSGDQPDMETATQQGGDAGASANADDADGNDDEDAVASFPALDIAATGTYSLSVEFVNTGASAQLSGWIDFDGDGVFEDDEFASTTVTSGTASPVNLDFDLDALSGGISAGYTYTRLRITRDTDVLTGVAASSSSTGLAEDGEVEDYRLSISGLDYSDAPVSYGDASHIIDGDIDLYIGPDGSQPDSELSSLAGVGAEGDDLSGIDDESGVTSLDPLTLADGGTTYEIDVTYNNVAADGSAILYGWIDFNADGDFIDANESASVAATSGTADSVATLSWTVPSGANLVSGNTYMRLRLTTDAAVTTSAPSSLLAADGEVEDYTFSIYEQDFGDAPLGYGVASHYIADSTLYLGNAAADTETTTQLGGDAGVGADGDDAVGADEGIVQLLSSGSNFPALNAESTSYQITVDLFNNTGSTGQLLAWIDFDQSGSFDEDEVGTVSTTIASSGSLQSKTISWSGLGSTVDIQSGQTYARFRLTTDTLTYVGDSGPDERADGAATDGEVEDYAIGIGNRDYGDAPDSGVGQGPGNYRSLLEDNGPRHTIVSGIRLGSTNPDIDINAFGDGTDSTGNAGDDELSGGDEGIAQLLLSGNSDFPELLSTTDSYSLDVRMANTSGGPVRIYAWIDFDQSGTFDEDEAAVASGLIGNVANRTLIWSSIPEDVTGGLTPTYMRLRITSDPLASDGMGGEDERSYGSASTGEVEDYPISIIPVDFGDAPDSYGTLDTSEGASHQVVSGIYLGDTAPDGEVDGFVDGVDDNLFALDDDSNGDEGIDQLLNGAVSSFPALNVGDATYGALTLDIATTANATVWGWIDFDQDGIFEESERAEAAVTSSDSTATLSWSGLPTMTPGNSYARFRIATNGSLADIDDADDGVVDDASINFASDGEIEDYLVTISGSGTISGRVFEDPNYGGGNGRDYATANSSYAAADVGVEATVELWASNGSSCTGGAPLRTTNANEVDGSYSFSGVALPDDYCVRVVNTSVLTNRTTSGGGLAVQTFRVESTDGFGTLDAIVNEVGGRSPGDVDSAANTFDDSYGDGIAAQSWSLISVGSSGISGIDFGYSFNTVVNTNSAGQGSLRQFILNANAMNDADGDGLAQSGQTAGIDVSIFAIPASDPNYNLLAQGEYYIGLDVSDGAFASLTSPVELNATTQTGISCPVPRIHIDGSALTGADGFDISVAADGSLVRGFVINGFDEYGIDLSADNSTLDCNYIGTDIGGNASGNGGNDRGIRITGDNNLVGGDRSTSGNVISGNNNGGLQIIGSGNQIYGNYIGLGSNGASQVANGGNGVSISGSDNLVGDSATASLRNRIAYNGDNGVRISSGTGNLVTANSIFNNGGLGLNLSGGTETGGVTANDSGDGDSGANNLLNYLTWNSVVPSGNDLEYDLDVDVPTGSYRIEFYANAVCNADQAGVAQAETHGEGQQLLGSISFTSSGSEINIDSDLDPGDNFPELSGVVPGLVGGEITALVIDDNNGHTSEFSACETAITSQVISGTIFDDVNYGGGSGRNYSTANADFVGEVGTQATVELWSSDGVLCTGGAPIQTVTSSASDGSYSFNVVATGATHCVRVVNDSVRSKRSGWSSSLIPVQTYRAEFPDDVAGSVTEVIDEVGGESPQDVDVAAGVYDRNAGDGSISQSVSFVDLPDDGTTAVTGVDFGFNFDTIVNTNSDGQGSFRQFILNANALGDENNLAQSGERLASSSLSTETLPTQTETSIFMISNASAGVDGINPTRQNLLVGAQYADISLDTSITVTDEDTNIDGTTLSVNINNPNGGSIGSNEAVGATGSDNLPGVYRPEVQVSGSQINLAASDVEVRGIAFLPTSTALNITASSDVLIENNVFGAGAITYADTGSGGSSDLVVVNGTSTGTRSIHNNLFGYGDNSGLSLTNTNGWSITENEFQGFGDAGLSIGSNTNDLIIEVNLFENNGVGLHLGNTGSDSASLVQDNSILSNTGVGLLIASGANGENENSIVQNLVSLNGDDGIQLNAGSDNTLSQNSIFNNQGLGINLTGSANSGAVIPVITSALATDGVNIDISGTYAGLAGDTLEFYSSAVCNGDTAGMAQATTEGEGQTFHSTTDADGGSGFSVQIPIADVAGSVITVMATDTSGNSSEFSVCSTALISDWGDAPESYGTTASANGPNHVRNDSLLLGSTVDAEEDGFVDGVDDNLNTASDDDLSGDDEDGVASFPPLTTAASSYSVDVSLENSTGANAYLLGWIDFDLNGTFDSNEAAMATVNNGATSATLNWNSVPIDIAVGNSFVRLRYSSYSGAGESVPASASAASPLGALLSGEVEDYLLPIAQGYDYGDAPASFDSPTPARHLRDGNLVYLGLVPPDGDSDSFGGDGSDDGYGSGCSADGSSGLAQDDDCEGLDDEDSATLLGLTPSDTNYTAQAVVTNNTGGTVYAWAWLDLNQNGEFESGEGVQESSGGVNSSGATVVTFSWPSFSSLSVGDTHLRIRTSSDAMDSGDFVGDLSDGEVEDYRIVVSQLTCDVIYGQYSDGSYSDLRTFDTFSGALGSVLADTDGDTGNFNVGSAGSGIDPITRRYYYAEWSGDTNGNGAIDLYYFDGASHVDTGTNLQNGGETENWNRLAFSPSGVGYTIEDDAYEILSFDTTTHSLTNEGTISTFYDTDGVTPAGTTGAGGDIAFDIDGNLYMVTYETAAINNGAVDEFFLWIIENMGTTPTARLLISGNSGGDQVAGIAFDTDNLLYLQDAEGDTYSWNVGTNVINAGAPDSSSGSGDLTSCIYPKLVPVLNASKTVENLTDPESPGFAPGDVLEYTLTIRNTGGIAATNVDFIDAIPANTTYVPNSTYIERRTTGSTSPVQVPDDGGNFPYATSTEIHSSGEADGTMLSVPSSGSLANGVVINFQVTVDSGTGFSQVCNRNGIVSYTDLDNNTAYEGTNDPSTTAGSGTTNGNTETTDPTCLDKFSGYSIEGFVYEDLDSDGTYETGDGETGISNIEVVLRYPDDSCSTVTTNASGYYFFGPLAPGNYTVYEAEGAASPTPNTCPPAQADRSGYLSSSENSISLSITSENFVDQNFGDIRTPAFSPNNSNVLLPGNTVYYAHEFESQADGTVTFSFAESGTPAPSGWSVALYEDADCNGGISGGESIIPGPEAISAGDTYCVVAQVGAPLNATAGDIHVATLTATFDFPGSYVATQVLQVTDTSTVLNAGDGALVLSKLVENLSCQDGGDSYPCDYDDGTQKTDNNAQPGDVLRYSISFQNIGTTAISGINIYDAIPAYTALDAGNLLESDCTNEGSDFTSSPSVTACTLIEPASGDNIDGYDGNIQWQLGGALGAGESGVIAFDVTVD